LCNTQKIIYIHIFPARVFHVNPIRHVYLFQTQIKELLNAAVYAGALRFLDISDNPIGDDVHLIAQMMQHNPLLKRIILKRIGLTQEGTQFTLPSGHNLSCYFEQVNLFIVNSERD
jgi:hypothetical protein